MKKSRKNWFFKKSENNHGMHQESSTKIHYKSRHAPSGVIPLARSDVTSVPGLLPGDHAPVARLHTRIIIEMINIWHYFVHLDSIWNVVKECMPAWILVATSSSSASVMGRTRRLRLSQWLIMALALKPAMLMSWPMADILRWEGKRDGLPSFNYFIWHIWTWGFISPVSSFRAEKRLISRCALS